MNLILIIYCLFSFIFFNFFKKISKQINLYDSPNHRKIHRKKISLSGGFLIFLSIYFYLIFTVIYDIERVKLIFDFTSQHIIFFIVSLSFFIIGFIDDKKNISANKKIVLFLILILFATSIDPKLEIVILYFSFTEKYMLLQNFSLIFTILSIFILLNALNMYDGSNAQLGIYVSIFIIYIAYKTQSYFILSFIVPIFFFLILNLRNITFVGNSGSYFLGFFLAYLSIKIYNSNLTTDVFSKSSFITSDEIFLLMFYPVIDLIRLFFYRIYNNRNPFAGDRNHIHHILFDKYKDNSKVQIILMLLTSLPLLFHEIMEINILLLIFINLMVYAYLVRSALFSYNNK